MKMDDEREPEAGRDDGTGGDPAAGNHDGQESAAEEALLRAAAPPQGEEVPLPPLDETPLEIPAELFQEEAREAPDRQRVILGHTITGVIGITQKSQRVGFVLIHALPQIEHCGAGADETAGTIHRL